MQFGFERFATLEDEGRCAAREGKGSTLLLTVWRRLIDSLGQDTVPAWLQQVETRRLPPSLEWRRILRFEENLMEKRAKLTASIASIGHEAAKASSRSSRSSGHQVPTVTARLFTICSTGSLCHKEEFVSVYCVSFARNPRVSRVWLYEYTRCFGICTQG